MIILLGPVRSCSEPGCATCSNSRTGDVAAVYTDLGLDGFRRRFTPIIPALATSGPSAIRQLARAAGMTHSAASQTVAHLVRQDLVVLTPGEDASQRIVKLTPKARRLVPLLEAEWAATAEAARSLEADLSFPLSPFVDEALDARCGNGSLMRYPITLPRQVPDTPGSTGRERRRESGTTLCAAN